MASSFVLSVCVIGISITALVSLIIAASTPGWIIISIAKQNNDTEVKTESVIAMNPFYSLYFRCFGAPEVKSCVQDDRVSREYGRYYF